MRDSLRIQSKCGKMRTRITPNTDTFYAVVCSIISNKNNSGFDQLLVTVYKTNEASDSTLQFQSPFFPQTYVFNNKAKYPFRIPFIFLESINSVLRTSRIRDVNKYIQKEKSALKPFANHKQNFSGFGNVYQKIF